MQTTPFPEHVAAFIMEHADADPTQLMLQAKRYPDIPMREVVEQISARQKAKDKLPSWFAHAGIWYPPKLSMEQCSSEATARWKAARLQGGRLADLTGGFGVDTTLLATGFEQADYVERYEALAGVVAHNLPLLGASHVQVHVQQAEEFLQQMPPADVIYLDPARRGAHNQKVVQLSDCEPDVTRLQGLLLEKAPKVVIKLSPMLDLSRALQQLPSTTQIWVIGVDNECKEVVFVLERDAAPLTVTAANLQGGSWQEFSFEWQQEQQAQAQFAPQPLAYLYEPNVCLLKAGAYKLLSLRFPVQKLHPSSHLYTSQQPCPDFPGRQFRIEKAFGLSKKELKENLKDMPKANITVRNFPLTVAELRKKTGLAEGGDTYLFATTLWKGEKVLLQCSRV